MQLIHWRRENNHTGNYHLLIIAPYCLDALLMN